MKTVERVPFRWNKIEEGWYIEERGAPESWLRPAAVQRWRRAGGAPGGKAGWYAWKHGVPDAEFCGPYRTAKEAFAAVTGESR